MEFHLFYYDFQVKKVRIQYYDHEISNIKLLQQKSLKGCGCGHVILLS